MAAPLANRIALPSPRSATFRVKHHDRLSESGLVRHPSIMPRFPGGYRQSPGSKRAENSLVGDNVRPSRCPRRYCDSPGQTHSLKAILCPGASRAAVSIAMTLRNDHREHATALDALTPGA
jgi:hypothetical protein